MSTVRFYKENKSLIEQEAIEHIRTCYLSPAMKKIRAMAEKGEAWQTFFEANSFPLAIAMYVRDQQNKHPSSAADWGNVIRQLVEYVDNMQADLENEFKSTLKKSHLRS